MAAGAPYSIEYIGGFSGVYQPYSQALQTGMQAAIDIINAKGGVNGHKLSLTTKDDAGDPSQAATVAETLVSSGELPSMVIPGSGDDEAGAIMPIIKRAGIPMLELSELASARDISTYPLTFGALPDTQQSMTSLVDHAKSMGVKSIAVFGANDSIGIGGVAELKSAAQSAGITLDGQQLLPLTAVNATAALDKLKAENPDLLIIEGLSGPLITSVFKDRAQLGWDVPTISDIDTTGNPIYQLVGASNLKNVTFQVQPYYVQGSAPEKTAAFKGFLRELNKLAPKRVIPLETYAAGWSEIALLEAGLAKAGSTDPSKLKTAIESLTVSEAPMWFQSTSFGFSSSNNFVVYGPDEFAYPAAGPRNANGALVPGSGS